MLVGGFLYWLYRLGTDEDEELVDQEGDEWEDWEAEESGNMDIGEQA